MMTQQQIDESLSVIQEVFRSFRPVLIRLAGNSGHTSKDDGSPVTKMDIEIETTLQRALYQYAPDVPVFGEETGYGSDLPTVFWLVDPIDGTQSFVDGTPTFTNMAVLIQDGEAAASAIYNPSSDSMYIARKGLGATRNDTRLDLTMLPVPAIAYCKKRFVHELNGMLKASNVTCTNGPEGGGYGFTLVADGLSAARFNLASRGFTHDYAPGSLLVRESGGVLIPVIDDEYTYETRSFIACHPDLEAVLRPHIKIIRALETSSTS